MRRSRGVKRPWAGAAIAVALAVSAGVLVANSHGASSAQSLQVNVGRITGATKLAAGGLLVATAAVVLLTPEITTHVIPHIFPHHRYIPPLAHPTVSATSNK